MVRSSSLHRVFVDYYFYVEAVAYVGVDPQASAIDSDPPEAPQTIKEFPQDWTGVY